MTFFPSLTAYLYDSSEKISQLIFVCTSSFCFPSAAPAEDSAFVYAKALFVL